MEDFSRSPQSPILGATLVLRKIDEHTQVYELGATRNRFLGHCSRNPLTGVVDMKNPDFSKDWIMTDMWKRGTFRASLENIQRDKFLFKAKPHALRTWCWHNLYKEAADNNSLGSLRELGLFDVLAMRLDEHANRYWSPLLVFLPLMPLLVSFTLDAAMVVVSVPFLMVQMALDHLTNKFWMFKYSRYISLLLRFPYVILVFVRFNEHLASADVSVLRILGYLCTVLMMLGDFYVGDIKQLQSKRDGAYLEVLNDLENRVFICRWHGPPHANPHYRIPEDICGVPESQQRSSFRHIMIITVIQGIICELEPLSDADHAWLKMKVVNTNPGEDLEMWYYGCDVYDQVFFNASRVLRYVRASAEDKQTLLKEFTEDQGGGLGGTWSVSGNCLPSHLISASAAATARVKPCVLDNLSLEDM
eukprot:TRINITY_DN8612_c0_g4_i1.p1 TRINITY_DN8612_c0_g4~~TRINITY_DN8612_c0_g4_i1.p1  ORF type:complete len:418 (+),score=74.14 TRINITY_DN8612_c0_g4_i1:160-1413(+)